MPGAVAVAVLNDNNELLMLNQYRHPWRMNLWEVPAGLLDIDGEDPWSPRSANSPKRQTCRQKPGTR